MACCSYLLLQAVAVPTTELFDEYKNKPGFSTPLYAVMQVYVLREASCHADRTVCFITVAGVLLGSDSVN